MWQRPDTHAAQRSGGRLVSCSAASCPRRNPAQPMAGRGLPLCRHRGAEETSRISKRWRPLGFCPSAKRCQHLLHRRTRWRSKLRTKSVMNLIDTIASGEARVDITCMLTMLAAIHYHCPDRHDLSFTTMQTHSFIHSLSHSLTRTACSARLSVARLHRQRWQCATPLWLQGSEQFSVTLPSRRWRTCSRSPPASCPWSRAPSDRW